jgi:hypothetical protein
LEQEGSVIVLESLFHSDAHSTVTQPTDRTRRRSHILPLAISPSGEQGVMGLKPILPVPTIKPAFVDTQYIFAEKE